MKIYYHAILFVILARARMHGIWTLQHTIPSISAVVLVMKPVITSRVDRNRRGMISNALHRRNTNKTKKDSNLVFLIPLQMLKDFSITPSTTYQDIHKGVFEDFMSDDTEEFKRSRESHIEKNYDMNMSQEEKRKRLSIDTHESICDIIRNWFQNLIITYYRGFITCISENGLEYEKLKDHEFFTGPFKDLLARLDKDALTSLILDFRNDNMTFSAIILKAGEELQKEDYITRIDIQKG